MHNRHHWTAGMMYVADEDLATVAAVRTVECERCDYTVGPAELTAAPGAIPPGGGASDPRQVCGHRVDDAADGPQHALCENQEQTS
jgi:hypothetical protein